MTKYAPLTRYLQSKPETRLPLTFAELERLLGFPLPPSARKHRAWWANNPASHVNAAAWHGGTLNRTERPRRAMHGFYVRRDIPQQQ